MTQKPDILTWLIVMPVPAWTTWSWHQITIKFVILQSFGNRMGCWISCWTRDFRILPATLNTTCASTNGSSLNILLFTYNFFCLLNQNNFFSKIPTLYRYDYVHLCSLYISAICISLRPINFSLQLLCIPGEVSLFVLTDTSNFCI